MVRPSPSFVLLEGKEGMLRAPSGYSASSAPSSFLQRTPTKHCCRKFLAPHSREETTGENKVVTQPVIRVVRDSTLALPKLKAINIPLLLLQANPAKASRTSVRSYCLGFAAS